MDKKKQQVKFKKLVQNFDTNDLDFSKILPYLTGELEVNLEDFRGNDIGKWNAIKTLWQLEQLNDPKRSRRTRSRSRVWTSPQAYKFLVQWSNAVLLRILGIKLFEYLKSPNSPLTSSKGWKYIDRLEGQFLDELRSVVANIEEGFARPTTSEYLKFLGYSQGSLKEARGDIERMQQDGLIKSIKGSFIDILGIDLKSWNEWAKDPANSSNILNYPLKKNKGSYRTLKDIRGDCFTYEMFIELINKTDYLLQKLVESLEKKLDGERKGYMVDQARISG
jgi:four helix bundle protein